MEPGTELGGGKYRIVRSLGSGGMGAVYEALNTHTRKRVAIKCLLPTLALSSPDATERLVREAEASCRVRHPHVVDVYDIVRDGHSVFLVMEYLEGEPLTAALDRGDLPLYRLICLLLPAMRAVAAAHAQGVVHRDIKPDNIFLERQTDVAEPVAKVLDFGISKLEARGTARISLTHAGAVMGTPMYMSYEQLLGVSDIDGRADVYAFGVVLYEALTGLPPYEARTHAEWLRCFSQPPIPPQQLRPQLPEALSRLVMACLASDRAKRVPNMDALIRELTPFATANSSQQVLSMPLASSVRSAAKPARTVTPLTGAGAFQTERRASRELPVRSAGVADSGIGVSRTLSGASAPRRSVRVLVAVSGVALALVMAAWRLARSDTWQPQAEARSQPSLEPPLAAPQAEAVPAPEPAAQALRASDAFERTDSARIPEGRVEPASEIREVSRSGAVAEPLGIRSQLREPAAPRGADPAARKHGPAATDWGIY